LIGQETTDPGPGGSIVTTREKIQALRKLMADHKLDAYYVPSVDPHLSEYVPACWQRRAWLSGFTGSMGDVVVTRRDAGLWVDSRYWLQAEGQTAGQGVTVHRLGEPGVPSALEHLAATLRKGAVLGLDPQVMSMGAMADFRASLEPRGVKIKALARNLVDAVWKDRPAPSDAPLEAHPVKFAGETAAAKLARLRAAMTELGVKAHVIGALDVIAWLFNVRSRDIDYTPVAIAYAVVEARKATLYVDPAKVTEAVRRALAKHVTLKPYADAGPAFQALAAKRLPVLVDPDTTNSWVTGLLKGCPVLAATSPVVFMKSVKNPVQQAGIRAAHVRDGVAMVKFLHWLEGAVEGGRLSEIDASDRLRAFREEQDLFRDESFSPISGYAAHGAIVHYSATPATAAVLKPRGLYLIDSGGQYLDGTTDITRTVALGPVPKRARRLFTRVLQGNLLLTRTPFPAGTSGLRLEVLARQPLFLVGETYGHGTGHGVGHYLGVHEGPMSVSPRPAANAVLHEGQFLSIEPGHYEAGEFGIRIENLAFVARDEQRSRPGRDWYRWDVVTLCPIDRRLIDVDLLSPDERAWIDAYHARVFKTLAGHLDKAEKAWLKRATAAL